MDASVLHSITASASADCDVTGMFTSGLLPAAAEDTEEEGEGEGAEKLGIAGLGDSPHFRKLQMLILRETCLREVVFMMVKVFKSTGRHFECVRLADLVADSRFGIYKASYTCLMSIVQLFFLILILNWRFMAINISSVLF